ncbi:uncharacterized protein LOC111984331 [Quercus suber]|uniref:uncharacterized protein LOC111984331 n=1 Tax=Quercus suber TaxID=58331 RepID=UPI0032DF18EA
MDREQEEMQFLSLFGIYKEACKIMYSWRRLLGQISLVLILPLSVIFLVHMQVSEVLFSKIVHSEIFLDDTRAGSHTYNKVSNVLSSEWTTFWLFNAAYFTILLILSLLSTSAVVYTIACIYTGREVDFKKVMSVVPKAFIPISIVFMILYFVGFAYMTIVWQLASVVTVLEDTYGFGAMIKSKALIEGKMGVAALTVLYFVCKSYHHENIDKSALSDHLEVYLGEYVPLKAKDVQLEQYHV